ncbi:plasmid transfer protein TraA [Streptomyces niveiscabiei]|uniref:plasmid transfer protein TraA n=1 Tax=Streptomyces TaxID=1883 RepID=UPI0006EB28C0|nr:MULTISPECIES: plasmid transfer protein TraA [Streptomyces]
MATNQTNNQRARTGQQTRRPQTSGNVNNSSKFADAGAAVGGFIGAVGGSFVPPINLTVNNTKNTTQGSGGRGSGSHFLLGDPQFNSSADVQNYCNHARALMIQIAIELAMAGKILEARLAQAQALPGDNVIEARMRAKKVGWKFKRAADGATASAKNMVAAYGAFTREYADLMRPRPQHAATTNPFRF